MHPVRRSPISECILGALLEELPGLLLDFAHRLAYILEQVDWSCVLGQSIVLLHDVRDALHYTVELQCDTDGLRHIVSVLDAHADQLGNLHELLLVSLANRSISLLVDELDDAIGLILGLSRCWFAIDGTNHEVFDVPNLWLVVDLIDEARLLLRVVAQDYPTAGEHLAAQADVRREVDELDGLLPVQLFHALLCSLGLFIFHIRLGLFLHFCCYLGRGVRLDQLFGCGHNHGLSRVMSKTSIVVII